MLRANGQNTVCSLHSEAAWIWLTFEADDKLGLEQSTAWGCCRLDTMIWGPPRLRRPASAGEARFSEYVSGRGALRSKNVEMDGSVKEERAIGRGATVRESVRILTLLS